MLDLPFGLIFFPFIIWSREQRTVLL